MPYMREINQVHVALPGLVVVEIAAADDTTAFPVQELLASRCAITPADDTDPRARRRQEVGCAASST